MFGKKNAWLSLTIVPILVACGGGDGGSALPSISPQARALTTATGKAVDGYLSAASVLCDANNNGVADSGESVVLTDSQGNFVFSPACSSAIVVSGGTNIDTGLPFTGLLKGPVGSTIVTPLTTLMTNGGLTAAQLAVTLGLPAGTDVTQIDPAAKNANGTLINAQLLKKTLAVHQIIQQVTDTLGSLVQDVSPDVIRAIYGEVANATVITLSANSTSRLVDGDGSVNVTLVSGIVRQSVKNITTTTNTALALVKTTAGTYSATSVSALVAGAIAIQAETLITSADTALTTQTAALQSNPTIANAASQLATLLKADIANQVDLATLGTALKQLVDTDTRNDAAASAIVRSEVAAQASRAGVPPPVVDVTVWRLQNNYFAIENDSIVLNGDTYTLSQFGHGVVLAQKPSLINNFGFGLIVQGDPIPLDSQGVRTAKVSLGIELTDTGDSGRVLQFLLDSAHLTVGGIKKRLLIAVQPDSKLYVYSKTASGIAINKTLTNLRTHRFVAINENLLTLNAEEVLKQLGLTNLPNITGTFNLKMVVSNVRISSQIDNAVKSMSITVAGSTPHSVTGLGVQGLVTVQ